MNDRAEGVDGIAVQENVDTDQRVLGVAVLLVIERGVTLRATLQLVEEVDDDFGERQPMCSSTRSGERYSIFTISPRRVWQRSMTVPV